MLKPGAMNIDISRNRHLIEGVTGVILAGGASSRMGSNKALLEVGGTPIISRIYLVLVNLFQEVIIVTNSPLDYDFIHCRKVPDIYLGYGSIAGLHSALAHSSNDYSFVTACDMPFIDPIIVRYLCDAEKMRYDAVIPCSQVGLEPLHAVYSSACKDIFENAIQNGERKIQKILHKVRVRLVSYEELGDAGGHITSSFMNVNTLEEYKAILTVK